jgi:hypothetical protein
MGGICVFPCFQEYAFLYWISDFMVCTVKMLVKFPSKINAAALKETANK